MKLILYLLILFLVPIHSYKIVALPFEVNQINFTNKKYSPTELLNLLFKTELYTPIQLGSQNEKYFGIISLDDHHPILSESNCEKMNLFQNNKNIIKKGYRISESKTCQYLGFIKKYLNEMEYGEIYTEKFSHFNTTLIEENKNNNSETSELNLIKDNYTKTINPEMCLSIGLGEPTKIYSSPSPSHFIDYLHTKRKIRTGDWTIKFNDQNSGLLIVGDLPEEYENDIVKYSKDNYEKINTKNIVTYFRPWAIDMKEVYFYNSTKDKILVNYNNNRFTLAHNFGFIIGSNAYRELIYEYYFEDLINNKICSLESSEQTIYNRSEYYIDTDGNYSMFICDKVNMDKYIKNFPYLYLSNIGYNYTFELNYKDLFMNINNFYYFMIIFPNNQKEQKASQEEWYMGLPFLKKYQFILNFDHKTIGFYRTKNFEDEEEEKEGDKNNPNNNKETENSGSKAWIYVLQILFVIILIIIAVFVGMLIKKQRKKRANELKDDDYDYFQEDKKDFKGNDIINNNN